MLLLSKKSFVLCKFSIRKLKKRKKKWKRDFWIMFWSIETVFTIATIAVLSLQKTFTIELQTRSRPTLALLWLGRISIRLRIRTHKLAKIRFSRVRGHCCSLSLSLFFFSWFGSQLPQRNLKKKLKKKKRTVFRFCRISDVTVFTQKRTSLDDVTT